MDADRAKEHDALVSVTAAGRAIRRVALPALLIALAAAPAASAQAPPTAPPDERAAAREFSFAAYRLRVKVLAQKDTIEQRFIDVTLPALGDPRCDRADKAARGLQGLEVLLVELALDIAPTYDPIRTSLDTFLAELERIPTADPALRSGRAGWRSEVQFIRQLQSSPDPCGTLQAWQRAKFAPRAAPVNIDAVIDPGLLAAEDKLKIAARRMQRLGVSAGTALRFTGDGMFDDVPIILI
jgi:hypothetical protein